MNIAIIHDSLMEFGGAERILQSIVDMYPTADLYTAMADPHFRKTYLTRISPKKFHVSWFQRFSNYQHHTSLIQALAPLIWRSFDLSSYDLVITSSTHIMSSLVSVPKGVHIASLQYAPKNIFGIDPKTPLQKIVPYDAYIRPMYVRALKKSNHVITNSVFTQESLKTHLNIHSTVIYPPVIIPPSLPKKQDGKFYLCISRLVPYKNLDLAIRAATTLHIPLKIFGVANIPSYERYLRSLAGPTVEILPFRTDFESYYRQSIAFIFPTKSEDFGIAPVEATAHGVPVISYYGGGAKETVVEGVTGTFFHTHTAESLIQAIKRLRSMHLDRKKMYTHAKRFDETRYRKEFTAYVDAAIATERNANTV